MQSSGNDSPKVFTAIAKQGKSVGSSSATGISGAVTTRRIRNGLEALAALPYYLVVCSFTQPRRMVRFLENIYEYQLAERVQRGNQRLIPTVGAQELFPSLFADRISLLDLGSRPSGTTFLETYIMVSLIKVLHARTIFEFGTSEGRTTLQFALNSPEDAKIFTLDLPDDNFPTQFNRSCPNEASFRKLTVGGLFEKYAECRKIEQLFQDSATVDIEPFRAKMDFIFIDGDHGLRYVESDSEHAFSMLSPRGVILWHDYGSRWPDVARYLQDLSSRKKLYHLVGTTLVLHGPSL